MNEVATELEHGLQVVVGLGQSGLSAVEFLQEQGFTVAITDGNDAPKLAEKLPEAVTIRKFGGIDAELLLHAERIVISPGISLETPAIAAALAHNISVVSDIQLFHEALAKLDNHVPIVAITGSNAKSTVTTLVGEMAKDAGINVGVGGNIGVPALTLLTDTQMELAVLELSSFQLETVTNLGAHVATILNLSPDHLDRHGDMAQYHEAKQRIFHHAKNAVVNRDDTLTSPAQEYAVADCVSFGTDAPEGDNFGLITDADGQVFLAKGKNKLLNTSELKVKGQHNQLNALAALALGETVGIPLECMLKTLHTFAGLAHRCQFIADIDGVEYFNDSKGTNMGSTIAAIKGLGESYTTTDAHAKLMLILGGQGKGQDFSELTPFINQFVSHLYFIGEDAQAIEQQLQVALVKNILCNQVATLDNAVQQIQTDLATAAINDTCNVKAVLLSPSCASFDQFTGYVQRGEHFATLVKQL